jgi:hypothetical protein
MRSIALMARLLRAVAPRGYDSKRPSGTSFAQYEKVLSAALWKAYDDLMAKAKFDQCACEELAIHTMQYVD